MTNVNHEDTKNTETAQSILDLKNQKNPRAFFVPLCPCG